MNKPELNDFVVVYGYFGNSPEVGRVKKITDNKLAINGIAQNNMDWIFTEFWLDIEKLNYISKDVVSGDNVWRAEKKH